LISATVIDIAVDTTVNKSYNIDNHRAVKVSSFRLTNLPRQKYQCVVGHYWSESRLTVVCY